MARFAKIVHLPPDATVEIARELICNLDPNGGAMTLVAYKNLNPTLGAMKEIHRRQVDAGMTTSLVPSSVDDFIVFLCAGNDKLGNSAKYEIPRRRGLWFLHGLTVMKANEVAQRSPERVRSVVDIWVHLIACSRVLRNALEHNVLWSDEEKSWFGDQDRPFSRVPTERKAMEWCINLAMPRWLRDNGDLMQGLAQYCLADMGSAQAAAYYREGAASFRESEASMNDVHRREASMNDVHRRVVRMRANLAAKYEEIAADIASGATPIRHSEIVWRNWQDDDWKS
jgi:hypothetical protein